MNLKRSGWNCIAAQEGMHDAVLAMGWFYLNGVGVLC